MWALIMPAYHTKNLSTCLNFYILFSFFSQLQEHLSSLTVVPKVQTKERLPGILLKVFFIILLSVINKRLQVICIEFNPVPGKENQELERASNGLRE